MNRELKQKIDEVVANIGSTGTTDALMKEAFVIAATEEEKREAGAYLTEAVKKRRRGDVDARSLLGEMTEAISLSYLARNYFGRDKTWLYQRMNRSVVNGKPACFTQNELAVLADSLKDLSRKLLETSSNIFSSLAQ